MLKIISRSKLPLHLYLHLFFFIVTFTNFTCFEFHKKISFLIFLANYTNLTQYNFTFVKKTLFISITFKFENFIFSPQIQITPNIRLLSISNIVQLIYIHARKIRNGAYANETSFIQNEAQNRLSCFLNVTTV